MRYPTNNMYLQTNRSDTLGNLMGTFNVNVTKNIGRLGVTRTIRTNTQSTEPLISDYPVGFKVFTDSDGTLIWMVAGARVFKTSSFITNAIFGADVTNASAPTDSDSAVSDIEVADLGGTRTLFVTANSKLYKRTTGAWTNQSFTGGGPWMMTPYASRLYFTIGALSQVASTSDGTTIVVPNGPPNTNAYCLQLDKNLTPTFIRASSNRLWVGTIATNGKGYIFEWDGVTTQPTRAYRLEAQGALACVIKDDAPYVMDSNGKLLVYSSGSFQEVTRLPLYGKLLTNSVVTNNTRFIHPNGMTVVDGKINLLINNLIDKTGSIRAEFCPSGVWELDDNNSLYHKYSVSYLPSGTNTITDYGQNNISGAGALAEMKLVNVAAGSVGDVLIGAKLYTNASSTDAGVFTNDTFDAVSGTTGQYSTDGAGYIVTTKITSKNIQDTWQKIYLFYRKLLSSSGRIIPKYRTSDLLPTEAAITWINTTAFSTTADVSAYLVGDEVEIMQGTGAGMCSHITAIQVASGPSYIVTLDKIHTGVTNGTGRARFQKWLKLPSEVSDQISQIKGVNVGKDGSWVQFKIFFIMKGRDEFEGMEIVNEVKQLVA